MRRSTDSNAKEPRHVARGSRLAVLTVLPVLLFVLPAVVRAVVISEINYNPALGDEDIEWVEVANDTTTPEDISGYSFVEGVDFVFPPGTVLGVVGHASGIWGWTAQPRAAHHQAIVLMHGTADPVVPYFQSVGGYQSFRDAGYTVVRLRSLEGWNHFPAEQNTPTPHTSQQLAWCEGMTTKDPARLRVSFEVLERVKQKEWHDYVATYTLAKRIVDTKQAPPKLRKRAARAMKAIDELAVAHGKALRKSIGKNTVGKFDGKGWTGHLPLFLRTFRGTPHADAFAERWSKVLERHKKDATAHLKNHYRAAKKDDEVQAFAEGVRAVRKGFLHHECENLDFLETLAKWRQQAEALGIARDIVMLYDQIVPRFEQARKEGRRTFETLNRKVKRF